MHEARKKWSRKLVIFFQYYVWVVPTFAILGVLFIYPGITALKYSFMRYILMRPQAIKFVGLYNYIRLLQSKLIHNSLLVTLYISFLSLGILSLVALAVALMLQRNIKYKSIFRTFLLLPVLIPPVVYALQWKWMFVATFGVVNHFLMSIGVIKNEIPWLHDPFWAKWAIMMTSIFQNLPFLALIFLAGLEALPPDVFDAAKTDGASTWQSFWYVTMPLVWPVLIFGGVYTLLILIQLYGPIRVLTEGGPGRATQVLSMAIYEISFLRYQVGMGSSLSILTIILALPIIVYFTKYTGSRL